MARPKADKPKVKPKQKGKPKATRKPVEGKKASPVSKAVEKPDLPVPAPVPRGGPSKYTRELADEILGRMAGGETVNAICRDLKANGVDISAPTVRLWVLDDRDGFSERYARAHRMMCDFWAEDQLDISDDGKNDWMEKRNAEGEITGWVVNGEAIARSKLRIDTRKWIMSKLYPGKYGEKIDLGGEVKHTVAHVTQAAVANLLKGTEEAD